MIELTASTIGTQDTAVHGLEFTPDGRCLAISRGDKTLGLWDTASREQIREYTAKHYYTRAIAFSPDGALLAVADGESIDVMMDGGQRVNRMLLPHLPEPVGLLRFSDDGEGLAGVIWEENAGRSHVFEWLVGSVGPAMFLDLDELVTNLWFARVGSASVGCYDRGQRRRLYRVRNIDRACVEVELDLGSYPAGGLPVSSSGGALLALGNSCFGSNVQLLGVPSGVLLYTSTPTDDSTPRVAFSSDDTLLAIARSPMRGPSSRLAVISTRDGRQIWEATVPSTVDYIRFSPSAAFIATVSQTERCASFWKASDGSLVAKSCVHVGPCHFSPDGRWFITGRSAVRITDLSALGEKA